MIATVGGKTGTLIPIVTTYRSFIATNKLSNKFLAILEYEHLYHSSIYIQAVLCHICGFSFVRFIKTLSWPPFHFSLIAVSAIFLVGELIMLKFAYL